MLLYIFVVSFQQKLLRHGPMILIDIAFPSYTFFAVKEVVTFERFQQWSRIPTIWGVSSESLQTMILWSNDCRILATVLIRPLLQPELVMLDQETDFFFL